MSENQKSIEDRWNESDMIILSLEEVREREKEEKKNEK